MRVMRADIGHSGELHKLYTEFSKDVKSRIPTPEIWLRKFSDPLFFILLAKHGKKPVGFVMGRFQPYFEEPLAEIDTVFVRRGFRGKLKFVRELVEGGRAFLSTMDIKTVVYNRTKAVERML